MVAVVAVSFLFSSEFLVLRVCCSKRFILSFARAVNFSHEKAPSGAADFIARVTHLISWTHRLLFGRARGVNQWQRERTLYATFFNSELLGDGELVVADVHRIPCSHRGRLFHSGSRLGGGGGHPIVMR